MAKPERRFRDRVGRFFRRLVQNSAKRAVPTRSPRRRLTPHKMACRLLPKTHRMFAFPNLVIPSALAESQIFGLFIPSESRDPVAKLTGSSPRSLYSSRGDGLTAH